MKTKTYIPMLTLIGLFLMSCTSSLQVSNTSSWSDEIYGSSPKPQINQIAQVETKTVQPENKLNSDLSKLEQKYSDVIEINLDSIKNDTIIYKAEDANPYNRILSESYEESYERRLRGLEDPTYGFNNWPLYNSTEYWYAQSYDPAYYNIIVMGGYVWVEPWYISRMFSWPRPSIHFSFGFGWDYPYYSYWNNPSSFYYWNWNYPYLAHTSPWYGNSYWWGYNNGYWHGNYNNNNDYYYGRRSTTTTDYSQTRRVSGDYARTTDNQTAVTRRGGNLTTTTSTNPVVTTRSTQTRVTPTYEGRSRRDGGIVQTAVTRREGNTARTEENFNTRRTGSPTREIGISEPTRRTYNTSTDRTRTAGNNGSPTRSTRIDNNRSTGTRGAATPTYNSPSRVSTPSGSQGSRSSSGSVGSSRSSSSDSYSGSRSSSSSSTSSSSSSSRNSNSSNSSSGSGSGRR